MSASSCPDLKFAKSRPRALDKQDRQKLVVSTDKAEDKQVKARSKNQCEVFIVGPGRCQKKAAEIHHMLGGWGRRARGRSALAEHKQHCCSDHHKQITSHILRLMVNGDLPRFDDAYERAK